MDSRQHSAVDVDVAEFTRQWRDEQPPDAVVWIQRCGGYNVAAAALLPIDLDFRLRAGESRVIESYLDRMPELANDPPLLQALVFREAEVRRESGETPQPAEFEARFPMLRGAIVAVSENCPAAEPESHSNADDETIHPQGVEAKSDGADEVTETASQNVTPPPPLGGGAAPTDVPARLGKPESDSKGDSTPLGDFGDFELLEWIAEGGMGVVYKARQKSLNRLVALKMIRSGSLAGESEIRRFQTEAEAAASLNHPNIVPVHAVGEHDGRSYFAMAYIDGMNLSRALARSRWSPRDAAELIATIADAVAAAHERGIIHRDLKPSNILITESGQPKVTDFGLAKRIDDDSRVTATGQVLGTPSYMAPEQAAGRTDEIGAASDVYGLGAVLYRILTGRPPFEGSNVVETLDQVRGDDVVPPGRISKGIPRDLESICLKCLEKRPADRYESATALAEDLRRYLSGEPVRARRSSFFGRTLRRIRRRPVVASLCAAVVLLSGILGYWYWNANIRVTVQHYAHMTRRWRKPVGIRPLTPDEAARRYVSYKFHTRGGRVIRVEVVSGPGLPTPRNPSGTVIMEAADATRYQPSVCAYEYRYDDAGDVAEEVAFDVQNHIVWRYQYLGDKTVQFTDAAGLPTARDLSGAVLVTIELDDNGYERTHRFLDGRREPRTDGHRVYGRRFEYNDAGLATKITAIDRDGRPMLDRTRGIAVEKRTYDEDLNRIRVEYQDIEGISAAQKDGTASVTTGYDDVGNLTEQAYFDLNGQPTHSELGVHRMTVAYDDDGHPTRLRVYDEKNRPTVSSNGTHEVRLECDRRGNITSSRYYGVDGRPTAVGDGRQRLVQEMPKYLQSIVNAGVIGKVFAGNSQWGYRPAQASALNSSLYGVHHIKKTFDDKGRLIRTEFFDVADKPASNALGYARADWSYDDEDLPRQARYFNRNGQPTWHRGGYHAMVTEFKARRFKIETRRLDLNEKPVFDSTGVYRSRLDLNPTGQATRTRFFGVDGKPAYNSFGICEARNRFGANGVATEIYYLDADGKPTVDAVGVSAYRYAYDDALNVKSVTAFDADGNAISALNGVHETRTKRNHLGQVLVTRYYGLNGKPVRLNGVHRIEQAYDERRRWIGLACFGPDGKPVLNQANLHRVRARLDKYGRSSRFEFFGIDDKPTNVAFGVHSIRLRFDTQSREVERAYFDAAGKKVAVNNIHRQTTTYRGRTIVISAFDVKDNKTRYGPVHQIRFRVDDHLRPVEGRLFGMQGEPVAVFGVHRWTESFDRMGRIVSRAFYDTNELEVAGRDRYHRFQLTYDDANRSMTSRLMGPDGQITRSIKGYQWLQKKHDRWGRIIETTHGGYDPRIGGFEILRTRFDEKGRFIEEHWLMKDGQPATHKLLGYSTRMYRYDKDGVPSLRFLDRNGNVVETEPRVFTSVAMKDGDSKNLTKDDVILEFNGRKVRTSLEFLRWLQRDAAAKKPHTVKIRRSGKTRTIKLVPGVGGFTVFDFRKTSSQPNSKRGVNMSGKIPTSVVD